MQSVGKSLFARRAIKLGDPFAIIVLGRVVVVEDNK